MQRLDTRLRRYFRSCGPTAAEDLTQEVLLSCFRARDGLRDDRALHAYVYKVARRVLARELSARDKRPESLDEAVVPEALTSSIDTDRIDIARLLDDECRFAPTLTEYYVEGRRAAEIARIHHVSEGTVRSRIRYGLEALRRRLQPRSGPGHAPPRRPGLRRR